MSLFIPEMVALSGGRTWIGSSPNDKFANAGDPPGSWEEGPDPFEMSRYPITVGEWQSFESDRFDGRAIDLPAHGISKIDADSFLAWLRNETGDNSWDLPSGIEWEHAARAGTNTVFPTGDTLGPDAANFLFDESIEKVGPGQLTPVSQFPPNAFGIHDLLGNVCEWCGDSGTTPDFYTIRGGAWDYLPRLLRCSWKDELHESSRRDNLGFRVVRRSGITPKPG